MKDFRTFVIAGAILTAMPFGLTSCGDDDDNDEPGAGSSNVEFKPTLHNFSRAGDAMFVNGDAISVWAMESIDYYPANLVPSRSIANNQKYTYQSGRFKGNMRKSDDQTLNYYAVYPYSSQYSDHFNFSVKTDQSVEANYLASDLCVGRTDAVTSPLVDINFVHAMCKIVINVDNSMGTVTSIELPNVRQSATIDLNDYTATSYGSTTTIKMAPNGSNSFKAIFANMTVAAGTRMAIIHSSKGDFVWSIESTTEFDNSSVYTFNLSKSDDSGSNEEVNFSLVILPWDEV